MDAALLLLLPMGFVVRPQPAHDAVAGAMPQDFYDDSAKTSPVRPAPDRLLPQWPLSDLPYHLHLWCQLRLLEQPVLELRSRVRAGLDLPVQEVLIAPEVPVSRHSANLAESEPASA